MGRTAPNVRKWEKMGRMAPNVRKMERTGPNENWPQT